jgi:hypothetical protein
VAAAAAAINLAPIAPPAGNPILLLSPPPPPDVYATASSPPLDVSKVPSAGLGGPLGDNEGQETAAVAAADASAATVTAVDANATDAASEVSATLAVEGSAAMSSVAGLSNATETSEVASAASSTIDRSEDGILESDDGSEGMMLRTRPKTAARTTLAGPLPTSGASVSLITRKVIEQGICIVSCGTESTEALTGVHLCSYQGHSWHLINSLWPISYLDPDLNM